MSTPADELGQCWRTKTGYAESCTKASLRPMWLKRIPFDNTLNNTTRTLEIVLRMMRGLQKARFGRASRQVLGRRKSN